MALLIKDLEFSAPGSSFLEHRGEFVETFEQFPERGFRLHPTRQESIRSRIYAKKCTFCGGQYRTVLDEAQRGGMIDIVRKVMECQDCGNWIASVNTSVDPDTWTLPFIREFQPLKHISALTTLVEEARKNPRVLHATSPREFELFVGSVLKSYFQCEVFHVGKSNDGGVDLVAIQGDTPLIVQVKRRQDPAYVEGVDVVRLLFASMFVGGAHRGLVVTTAQRFSRNANEWAHLPQLRDSGFQIDLAAFDRLLQMTKSGDVKPTEAWKQIGNVWKTSVGGKVVQNTIQPSSNCYTRYGNGSVVVSTVVGRQRCAFIRDNERGGLWLLPDASPQQAVERFRRSGDRPDSGTFESGGPFHEVLHNLPFAVLDRIVEAWFVAASEGAVSWSF